ncbi:hypothetical protein HDU91_006212 [Kappamyces sp. JEL0680]|nr:hypothetical protein HDU91_006212 [Kappamyces sp. JEL0680]
MSRNFEEAAEALRLAFLLPGIESKDVFGSSDKLQIYAYFKYATKGPANDKDQPSWWDTVNRHKFDAWKALGSELALDQAKTAYVGLAIKLLEALLDLEPSVLQDYLQSLSEEQRVGAEVFFHSLPALVRNLSSPVSDPTHLQDISIDSATEKRDDSDLSLRETGGQSELINKEELSHVDDLKSISSEGLGAEILELKQRMISLEERLEKREVYWKSLLLGVAISSFLLGRLDLYLRHKK